MTRGLFCRHHRFPANPAKRFDEPPAAHSFPSCRKRMGRKGALVTVWCVLRADRVVRPYGVRVHRNLTVRADGSVGPVGRFGFAEDFSKTGASCRVDVGIDPYNAYRRCIKNSELHQASREKSRKTEGVFLVGSRGAGGKSKSPRARFLFPIFSFGEAKEKTERQPQISNTSSYLAVRLKMLRLFVYSTPATS